MRAPMFTTVRVLPLYYLLITTTVRVLPLYYLLITTNFPTLNPLKLR